MNRHLLLLLTAMLLATLACGTVSTTPTPRPTDTAAAPPSTNTPPPPTATSQPTETTDGSGIELLGPPEFIDQAQAALDMLASCDSAALALVDRQLEQIVHSDRSGVDTTGGVFMVSDVTAFAPNYPPKAQVFWFAGAMVHDSHHRVQSQQGLTMNWDQMSLEERQAIEHDAREVQIEAMKNCVSEVPQEDHSQVEGMIEYLVLMQTGEIPCDYCEIEWADRDW